MSQRMRPPHDARLELKTVLLLALGFGLVGIDRFMISTLFPVIAKDLSLDYGDIGVITGALAIAWGLAALFMGSLSDRIGRRRVMVGSMVVFSALIGLSGLAGGLASLVLVRVLMGFADGAFTPASISMTMEVSAPHRRGRNIGLQQLPALLFGLGFAPLLIPPLLHVIDWRWVFALFVLPGFLVAWHTWRIVPAHEPAPEHKERSNLKDWAAVVAFGNIRIGMVLMLCWLTCLVTVSAFLPNYMIDHLKLSFAQMGTVMSAIGLGGAAGTLVLPWLSDHLGRRTILVVGAFIVLVSLILLSMSGPQVPRLFACLFFIMFGTMAMITLTVGPLCTETVPRHLTATASGVVIATGELLGGGLAPIAVGAAAQRMGVEHILWLPIGTTALALLLCTMVRTPKARLVELAV